MSLEQISGKVFCAKCFRGKMTLLKKRTDNHGFFQCSYCRKIDEVGFLTGKDGEKAIFLVPKEWEEVLDESVEGLIRQLQNSARHLTEWREQKSAALGPLQSTICAWKELQHIIYYFPTESSDQEIIKLPWQFTFIEADRELMASRVFAALGYYKDALKSLRSYMELCLFGLFIFSRNDEQYFKDWFVGARPAPPVTGQGGLIHILARSGYLRPVNERTGWTTQMEDAYGRLSQFIHSRGKEAANLWLWQKAQPEFNENAWNDWINSAVIVVKLVLVAAICQFPRSLFPVSYFEKFGFDGPLSLYLDHEQVQVIRGAIAGTQFAESLRDAIEVAPELQREIASIEALPDLSSEAIDKTLKRFIDSVQHVPERIGRVKEVLTDPRFQDFPTIRWSILLNMERAFTTDSCLALIAKTLDLIKPKA